MNRLLRSENLSPVLVCQGTPSCGWQRHSFVEARPAGALPNHYRQFFACERCDAERAFGSVDLSKAAPAPVGAAA